MRQTIERHGRIDVLVNNAGIFQRAKLLDTDLETYRRIIDVNQVGVFLGMKAVAPTMIEQGAGSIVNISSVAGLRAAAGGFAYGASKFAVTGMTKSAAMELARHGVRVNSIHPGIIETDMMNEVTGGDAERHDRFVARRAAAPRRRPVGGRPAGPVPRLRREQLLHRLEFVVDGGMSGSRSAPRSGCRLTFCTVLRQWACWFRRPSTTRSPRSAPPGRARAGRRHRPDGRDQRAATGR